MTLPSLGMAGLLLLVGSLGCRSLEPAVALEAEWEKDAVVRLSQGHRVAWVDLQGDIEGCHGEMFDPTTGEHFGSGLGKIRVLDVAESGGQHFVLVSALAYPNCNIQGECGAAGPNVTLIWLQLGGDLSVVAKEAFTVEYCRHGRWVEGLGDDWPFRISLSGGSLRLTFKEQVSDPGTEGYHEVTGQVTYDRRTPAAGIQVTRVAQ